MTGFETLVIDALNITGFLELQMVSASMLREGIHIITLLTIKYCLMNLNHIVIYISDHFLNQTIQNNPDNYFTDRVL
jgi:hypothetical protein